MSFRIILLSLGLLFSALSIANDSSKDELGTYIVRSDGVAKPFSFQLPKRIVNDFKTQWFDVADHIRSCSSYRKTIKHPAIRMTSEVIIKQTQLGCNLTYNRLNTWEYDCFLTKSSQQKLADAIHLRMNGLELLGDLSEQEKAIYFSNTCRRKSLSK
jgi:hypothetical protein